MDKDFVRFLEDACKIKLQLKDTVDIVKQQQCSHLMSLIKSLLPILSSKSTLKPESLTMSHLYVRGPPMARSYPPAPNPPRESPRGR